MNIFQFLLGALGTYRLTLLFTAEYGPAGMFEKLRKVPPKKSDTAQWLHCPWCFSLSASAFVCLLLWWAGTREHPAIWFLIWLSFSIITICLNQTFTRGAP